MGGREGTDGREDKRKPKDKQKGKVSPRTLSENVWQFEAHLEKKTKQEGRSGKGSKETTAGRLGGFSTLSGTLTARRL